MQGKTKVWMLDQGKEPISAIANPLHDHTLTITPGHRLDECGTFPQNLNRIAVFGEERSIGIPRCSERLARVVEEVDVLSATAPAT